MNTAINTPKLSIYHPNAKGTGAAIQFELRPAHGMEDGAIYCRIANQKGNENLMSPCVRFDWKKAIVTKFDFTDVCKILQVFRGETESIAEGKGLYHRSTKGENYIKLSHRLEPITGYLMEFLTRDNDGNEKQARIFLSNAESLGLAEVFICSLKEIAFGTSFEATSIAFARAEAIAAQAAEIAAETARKEREEADEIAKDKAVAKTNAVMRLRANFGEEHTDLITRLVDIACGDLEDDNCEFNEDYRKLGIAALGEDHPIWKFVVK